MRTRATIFALFLAVSLIPGVSVAGPWLPARGEYYSEIRAGRSESRTFYNRDGLRFPFGPGGALESRSLNFYNEFGWKSRISVVLAAPILSNTRRSGNSAFEGTETGLGDLTLGFRIKVMGGRLPVSLQLDWTAPLGYETRNDTLVGAGARRDSLLGYAPRPPVNLSSALGPGRQNYTARLELGREISSLNAFVELGGGYRVWAEPYEDQMVADGKLGFWLGSNILLLGHYDGQVAGSRKQAVESSMRGLFEGNGRVTVQHVEYSRVTSHVAGPEIRYRVDNRLDVFAGSNHTMAGKNSIHGDAYYVGMAFRQSKHNRLQGLLGNQSQP